MQADSATPAHLGIGIEDLLTKKDFARLLARYGLVVNEKKLANVANGAYAGQERIKSALATKLFSDGEIGVSDFKRVSLEAFGRLWTFARRIPGSGRRGRSLYQNPAAFPNVQFSHFGAVPQVSVTGFPPSFDLPGLPSKTSRPRLAPKKTFRREFSSTRRPTLSLQAAPERSLSPHRPTPRGWLEARSWYCHLLRS